MSLTSFVVCRHWASNRLRTALTVLGIAVGVAIVVAIYVMDHNTIQSRFRQQERDRGPVDLTVRPLQPRPVAEVLADLRARAGIADVGIWREARADLAAAGRSCPVTVFGLEGGVFHHYVLGSGRDLGPADGERAVLLGAEAARLLAVPAGASITLRSPAHGARYECRDGKLVELPSSDRPPFTAEVTVAGVLTNELLGHRDEAMVLVCARSLAERLVPAAPDLFQIQRTYGADLDRLRRDLRADYVIADVRAAQLGEGADERAFRNGLKVLGCLALLLGMFVVFQTLSHSLMSRLRLLGLLRCLGASRGAVARVFLGDAVLLGCAGAALGLLLGIGLAALLKHFQISSLGTGKGWDTFELPLVPMAWTAALGIVFTLAGALFPLWRARQLPALWILRQRGLGGRGGEGGDVLAGVNVWLFVLLVFVLPLAYLGMTPLVAEEGRETLIVLLEMAGMLAGVGGLLLLAPLLLAVLGRALLWPLLWFAPLPAWLCRKTIDRQSGRIAAGVVGLAAVLLALLGLKSITAALRGEVQQFADAALAGRSFVELPARSVAACAGWTSIPGVAAVEPIAGEVESDFVLRGLDVGVVGGNGGALEGHQDLIHRYADARARTLIASRRLAEELKQKLNWSEGKLVSLRDRNGAGVSYEVLLVSDASGFVEHERAWAVTSPHWLRADWCVGEQCVQHATLRLQPGADPDIVGARLRGIEPGLVRYKTGDYIAGYLLRDVDRDFYVFDLLLLLILLLAGTGLLNGMTIAALGRARELGVLAALGVGPRTLRLGMLVEGLLTGGLAALLAVLLTVPMAHLLVAGLNRVAALSAPLVLPVPWLAGVPAIALVTGALASLLPAARVARQDPAAAVRCE